VNLQRVPKAAWIGAALVLLAVLGLVVALVGFGSSSAGDADFTGSGYPGLDLANTRKGSGPINSSSVAALEEAWSLPVAGESTYGSYASTPIISKGVIYSQDLTSNVEAIALSSGEVLWEKSYEDPSHGPNGLVVADGLVYGATTKDAFALDQETGEEVWSTPLAGEANEGIDMAPGYHDGKVYVATVPVTFEKSYGAGAVGVLWALDGKTGKKLWHFDTVPKDLWGHPDVNSGGGLWYPPSFDGKGSIYFGTGNPGPLPGSSKYPWGSSRPGPNLYADSMVKLDEKSGRMRWYYQQTPHNIYDWDFQNSPVLVSAGGREMAIGSGKSGVVVALDAKSGKPIWKRSVGTHNGHDKDNLYAMRGEYSKIETGEALPGQFGGVIAPMATDGKTLFVAVTDQPMTVASPSVLSEPKGGGTGELVAIDLASGKVRWAREVPQPSLGAPTVVNDLVFVTTADGVVDAVDTGSGEGVWQSTLPAGINTGVIASGKYLIAPAGLSVAEGQAPEIIAFRLPG
jgi:alcohol dehydrogenase (cytochrome c)